MALVYMCTSDLQKLRHLLKSRVRERHNRGTKRKLKSQAPPQEAPFFALFCAALENIDFRTKAVTSKKHSAHTDGTNGPTVEYAGSVPVSG